MSLLSEAIKTYQLKSYADSHNADAVLDCSLGVHYDPVPESVMQVLRQLDERVIREYPTDETLYHRLIEKFRPVVALTKEQITLGDGSCGLLASINTMYLPGGKTVYSYAPHFSAFMDHAYLLGAQHKFHLLKEEENYALDLEAFLAQMQHSGATMVYLENPNNPTGQALSPKAVEAVVAHAKKLEMAIIVDEAYGDYLPLEYSAARFVNDYEHLFVVRTFSKGYGLAGLRAGYVVSSKEGAGYLQKMRIPFNCSGVARAMASAFLEDMGYLSRITQDTRERKTKVMEAVEKTNYLKVAQTYHQAPIMLLYTPKDVDLCQLLNKVGLNTVSGQSFEGLGQNSVRVMMTKETDLLIELLRKADVLLGELL